MSTRLFGTDGVRGRAGTYPLDHVTVRRLGAALVRALSQVTPRVIVGRDTRESGGWIERELAHGARTCGAEVISAGIIPTPAIAYLTRALGFTAGVVISASHNPYEDNGIKVFSGGGEKFSEDLERRVESIVADASWEVPAGDADAVPGEALVDRYLAHVREALPDAGTLAGARVAVDCANGATTTVAPRLFRDLGLDVTLIGDKPDGRNINLQCGSTHPEALASLVVQGGHRLGVAFDGDGDRAIFVDEHGRVVDGDAVMLMCARRLQAEGRLKGQAVVATVMSNIGLELALKDSGIELVRCQVGDKYVMEELLKRDLSLGGEQSGHVIFTEHLFTGDGLVTALHVLRDVPQIAALVDRVEGQLAGHGRLLVRYSGTEPLLRIMLEGRDEQEIRAWAGEIAEAVRTHLA